MKDFSEITGKYYEVDDMVFFRNTLQSSYYIFHGAKLYDLFIDDNMRMVFVFSKADHEKLKMSWKNSSIGK